MIDQSQDPELSLDATLTTTTHLYKRVCPSVGRSVGLPLPHYHPHYQYHNPHNNFYTLWTHRWSRAGLVLERDAFCTQQTSYAKSLQPKSCCLANERACAKVSPYNGPRFNTGSCSTDPITFVQQDSYRFVKTAEDLASLLKICHDSKRFGTTTSIAVVSAASFIRKR